MVNKIVLSGISRPVYICVFLIFFAQGLYAEDVKHILTQTVVPDIPLVFDRAGYFKRPEGDIWWLGFAKNDALMRLQSDLSHRLSEAGFMLENRSYTPHVTIARRASKRADFTPESILNESFSFISKSIALMRSEQINGQLKYTCLFETK